VQGTLLILGVVPVVSNILNIAKCILVIAPIGFYSRFLGSFAQGIYIPFGKKKENKQKTKSNRTT
jgi:hypothetical protein